MNQYDESFFRKKTERWGEEKKTAEARWVLIKAIVVALCIVGIICYGIYRQNILLVLIPAVVGAILWRHWIKNLLVKW